MTKYQVEALRSFSHGGRKKPGDRFMESVRTAEQLQRKGLVRIIAGKPDAPPSASPAAPVSPRPNAITSDGGEKRGRKGSSSASTPATE